MFADPDTPTTSAILVATIVGTVGLAVVGLLWAPVAAVVCSVVARKRGLKPWVYAIAGTTHSVLFLFPWVYLLLRMYDVRPHRAIVTLGYLVLYAGAASIMAFYLIFAENAIQPLIDPEAMRLSKSSFTTHIVGDTILAGVIAALVGWHVFALWRLVRHALGRGPYQDSRTLGLYGPRNVFRTPFAVTWVSLLAFPPLWILMAIIFIADM